MLFIGEPYIAQNGDRSRLVCDIGINRRETRTVWFEVDREYEKYLCTERSDAYVIGLLSWAMRAGHDITCTVPVSEELLYALREYLIPSLVKYAPSFRAVEINAPAAGTPLANAGAVGTGLSCGIDSFHVISRQLASPYKTLNLTHLCHCPLCLTDFLHFAVVVADPALRLPLLLPDAPAATFCHGPHGCRAKS